jgi:hypothetical protein
MVSKRTKTNGARKVKRKPTLRASKNWEIETIRKKRLKKNLNWLKRTKGMKFIVVYF